MNLFEQLQELMLKYHFRPNKKHSQYFCTNEALLTYMVNKAKLTKDDIVLEIGPGVGFLTRKLLEKCKVVAIEIDHDMVTLLNTEFAKEIASKQLTIIEADALSQNFTALGITKIVSLPPYHISTPLVAKIVASNVSKTILVLDKGFEIKLTAFEGFSEYGWLSVFANLNEKIALLEPAIEATSFFPSPNCVSVLLELDSKNVNTSPEFLIFIKELFRHKNKDLSRALKQAAPFLEKELMVKDIFKRSATLRNGNKKVYLHSPQEFAKIFDTLILKK